MLIVGIPKEIKAQEMRVGLTPECAGRLIQRGIGVFVQHDAGLGSGYPDESYRQSGAEILPDARSVYDRAGLIQKVKEPLEPEFSLLRERQTLFCFLHLASPHHRKLLEVLLARRITSLAYETVQKEGETPLLRPMSEIAGALVSAFAILIRAKVRVSGAHLEMPPDFHELLTHIAGAYPAVPPGLHSERVAIFGGGVAGEKALEFTLKMGGEVLLIEKNEEKRRMLLKRYGSSRFQAIAPMADWESCLAPMDILIGCAHAPGCRAVQVMDSLTLKKISKDRKKIIMDVAVDQGGNFPETHPTSYEDPLYLDSFGNIRFAVSNVPSLCGRGASEALAEASWQYTAEMAQDFESALHQFPELASGVNTRGGEIQLQALKEAHRL